MCWDVKRSGRPVSNTTALKVNWLVPIAGTWLYENHQQPIQTNRSPHMLSSVQDLKVAFPGSFDSIHSILDKIPHHSWSYIILIQNGDRRVPIKLQETEAWFQNMITMGIITPDLATTVWVWSRTYPRKAKGSIHVSRCKGLNAITYKHHKPLALQELTHRLSGS